MANSGMIGAGILGQLSIAQDADDVLDKDCNPISNEDKDLFQEKKKFMCSVFEQALLADQGKALVRQWKSTYDS